MAWIYLVFAGLFEICWAVGLKYSEGFSRLWPSVWTIATMIASFQLLSAAMKSIPIGTAYAVWTGIGAAGTAIIGFLFFKDPVSFWRIFFLVVLVGSIVGLKAVSTGMLENRPPASFVLLSEVGEVVWKVP